MLVVTVPFGDVVSISHGQETISIKVERSGTGRVKLCFDGPMSFAVMSSRFEARRVFRDGKMVTE